MAQHADKRKAGDVLLGLVLVSRDREGCLFADNGFLCPFLAVASAKMARESVYKCVLAERCSVPAAQSSWMTCSLGLVIAATEAELSSLPWV